ncbi:MAG: VanW family protein [Deltaproteobacteria bacterium]|nr:VanW family protein [Deltaproteobacteria bacterium]
MAAVERKRNSAQGSVLVGLSVLLLVVGAGLVGGYAYTSPDGSGGAEQVQAEDVDPKILASVDSAAKAVLDREVTVAFEGRELTATWRQLGLQVDSSTAAREADRLGASAPADLYQKDASGGVVPLQADRDATAAALIKLKAELDRAPVNARLDLEARKVHKAQPGYGIEVFGSITAVEAAARAGADRVELDGVEIDADITVKDLGIDDISVVISRFETRFAVYEKSRNDNLKLAASKIDGHVLQPGQEFSFNKVVGARSEKEGYKIAHVITAGEMVDGLAGGACQISTTLHGAAFFSGMEIVSSTPHSRPSTYVQMGLDATVVWPNTDLKLKNSFDFPVVIHYRVARGRSVVEILGKAKPFDEVRFERRVQKQLEFDTITREDKGLPVGSMVVEQDGFPGYKLKRYRKLYKDGKLVKTDSWNLRYRPVTEYARLGINPDPNLPPPKQKKGHGPRPPRGRYYSLSSEQLKKR